MIKFIKNASCGFIPVFVIFISMVICGLLTGCDATNSAPNGSFTVHQQQRYADFNESTDSVVGYSGGNTSAKWIMSIKLSFEPTRVGAYLIKAGDWTYKYISPADQSATKPIIYDIPYNTSTVEVTFSNGQDIQSTDFSF